MHLTGVRDTLMQMENTTQFKDIWSGSFELIKSLWSISPRDAWGKYVGFVGQTASPLIEERGSRAAATQSTPAGTRRERLRAQAQAKAPAVALLSLALGFIALTAMSLAFVASGAWRRPDTRSAGWTWPGAEALIGVLVFASILTYTLMVFAPQEGQIDKVSKAVRRLSGEMYERHLRDGSDAEAGLPLGRALTAAVLETALRPRLGVTVFFAVVAGCLASHHRETAAAVLLSFVGVWVSFRLPVTLSRAAMKERPFVVGHRPERHGKNLWILTPSIWMTFATTVAAGIVIAASANSAIARADAISERHIALGILDDAQKYPIGVALTATCLYGGFLTFLRFVLIRLRRSEPSAEMARRSLEIANDLTLACFVGVALVGLLLEGDSTGAYWALLASFLQGLAFSLPVGGCALAARARWNALQNES